MLSETQLGELERVGALRLSSAIESGSLERLKDWSKGHDAGQPGERIEDLEPLRWLLREGVAGEVARSALGPNARPVRALLFDKSGANNWALGWHQDRTIAVKERQMVDGFHVWSVKSGVLHVEPPFEVIQRMVTLRIHLDAVDADNSPLLVAPGSHLLGRLPERAIDAAIAACGEFECLAEASDIWIYRTAIVHASKRAQGYRRRRVLQVDFSADELPGGLNWWAA